MGLRWRHLELDHLDVNWTHLGLNWTHLGLNWEPDRPQCPPAEAGPELELPVPLVDPNYELYELTNIVHGFRECLDYVLHKCAGSSSTTFQGGLRRDIGRSGETIDEVVIGSLCSPPVAFRCHRSLGGSPFNSSVVYVRPARVIRRPCT